MENESEKEGKEKKERESQESKTIWSCFTSGTRVPGPGRAGLSSGDATNYHSAQFL